MPLKPITRVLGSLAALAVAVLASQPAFALQLQHDPDIKVAAIEVRYDSSTGAFSALGSGETFIFGPGLGDVIDLRVTYPYFDLFADISTSGVLAPGGHFDLYDDLNFNETYDSLDRLYLAGSLSSLDFTLGNPALNFLFTPLAGEYLTYFGPQGGIILGESGLDSAGFNRDFNVADATADIGTPVPEPSTVSLLLLGMGGLAFARRRRRAQR